MKMKLNDIINKLAKYNFKRYLLFCISVVFSVAMLGAYGVLQFSPTITNVLVATGSTYMLSLGMFVFTVIGMVIFLIYANDMYLKYKMEQIGVFLSLGLKRQAVLNMLKKEFYLLFGISAAIGLILSVPIAFLFWSCLTLFLETTETAFIIGWYGLLAVALFIVFMWALLTLLNSQTLKRMDIIKVLKISSEIEEMKFCSLALGLTGLVSIPVGFVLFNLCETMGGFWGRISLFFLALSLIGLYLFTSEITSLGSFFKKYFPRIYFKNLLFFNLVKQKGRQYTLSLFVSTILIAITIFGLCFNSAAFIDSYFQSKNDPYDYALLISYQQTGIDEFVIRQLANDYEIKLQKFIELDMLLIGRQHRYNRDRTEWSGQYVTNEFSYNLLTDSDIEVPEGMGVAFDDLYYSFNTFYGDDILFYNPTLEEEFGLALYEKMEGDNLINRAGAVSDFIILDDSDYEKLKSTTDSKYQLKYYLFTVQDSAYASDFHGALLNEVVKASDGLILDNFFDSPVRKLMALEGKDIALEDSYIPYEGNELYAARWWDMYPFSRATSISTLIESGAIYLLLMFFIAVIAFISAVMIIGLKVLGSVWQDSKSYQKAVFLGLKEKALKQLISKQIALIYFYPTILGCIIGVIMINQIVLASSAMHVAIITLIATALSLLVFIIQIVVFIILRRRSFIQFKKKMEID